MWALGLSLWLAELSQMLQLDYGLLMTAIRIRSERPVNTLEKGGVVEGVGVCRRRP